MEMTWTGLHSSPIPAVCGWAQVCTYTTFQTGEDQTKSKKAPNQPFPPPWSEKRLQLWVSSCFSLHFLHLQLTQAPSQRGRLSSVPISVPSTAVTEMIKKHFLSESRQGGDPALSLHARDAGTCPAQQHPLPQPSPASPTAPTGQAKGTKKQRATQPWLSQTLR